ncbi:MAG TPA: glycoside hydrolase family 43 protein, partial [Clostridiales bacterium]|nr:glycoside hydrolase family 43 protein [Clostridiales bacterium]
MKYLNPVIAGSNADPSVIRVNESYYLVTSSCIYFPGVPVYKSLDLVHWKLIGYCLTRDSQLPLEGAGCKGGIWAPTLRFHNGRYYMISTNQHGGGHFYVTSDDIEKGEWSDPIWLEGTGHDPDLFFDDDGRVYFSRFSWEAGILSWEIDIHSGRLLHGPYEIWKGFEDKYCEAPHLYKINGMYYLLAAEGGTRRGHMVVAARSAHPSGPYESCPQNPILTHRHRVCIKVSSTGHGDLVQAHDGSWWLVFLATRHDYGNLMGRETFLAPVAWTDGGWPVINERKAIRCEMEAECLPLHPWPKDPVRDDFDAGDRLSLSWNFQRNPRSESWSLTERPDWLVFKCIAADLCSSRSKALICRKQQHYSFEIATKMEFIPKYHGDEAGLTVINNEQHHYEIAVAREEEQVILIVRRRIGDLAGIVYRQEICERTAAEGMILLIRLEKGVYSFGFIPVSNTDEGKSFLSETVPVNWVASGSGKYLDPEVLGVYTGVFL